MKMEVNVVTVLTALSTLLIGLFGKDFYGYLIRSKEIESGESCKEKIRKLEIEMANERAKTNQIITGVDMMLTMFEGEYADDPRYMNVISKVRDFIKIRTDD